MTPLAAALARQAAIITLLGTLPPTGSLGEGGRSLSIDRPGLIAELKYLTEELIPQLTGPWILTSTGRSGY